MPDSFMGFNIAARLPNLGLVSIAGNSDPKESEYGVLDLILHQKEPMKYVKYFLDKFQPDYVGLNAMTFQFYTARKIAKYIKEEYNPDIKVLMGGYHATLCYDELSMPITDNMPEELKKNTCPWCDYFVRGEGEFTLRELIHAEREKLPLRNILGLSWRGEDGKFRHNARRPVADLKTLKRPDRDVRLLKKGYHIIGKPADTVETSRGCVNKCKFCSIRRMYGQG
ncbi:MAG: B12-binding domain-containing radical SAM protein, partial [Promethearchaeota archaeon]